MAELKPGLSQQAYALLGAELTLRFLAYPQASDRTVLSWWPGIQKQHGLPEDEEAENTILALVQTLRQRNLLPPGLAPARNPEDDSHSWMLSGAALGLLTETLLHGFKR